MEEAGGLIAGDIGSVARIAILDIALDVSQHPVPVVSEAKEAVSLVSTGISRRYLVVGFFNQPGP
jgi:vacuolar-type H+-ATPase subunit B/Vma2